MVHSLLKRIVGFRTKIEAKVAKRLLRRQGVALGPELTLFGIPIITCVPGARIELGQRVTLCSTSRSTTLGVSHPVILRALRQGATLTIGDDVGISGGSICATSSITIGARTLLGADVVIADTDFHSISPKGRRYSGLQHAASSPVTIGEDVFIGTGTVVLKGVAIGANSVIGAKSVVTKSIPKNVVAAGNPCRVIASIPDLE